MVDFLQQEDGDQQFFDSSSQVEEHFMVLSAAAQGNDKAVVATLKLTVLLQNQPMVFLVDSGSTHSFLDSAVCSSLSGVQPLRMPVTVKVANGQQLQCTELLPHGQWSCAGYQFDTPFQFIPLGAMMAFSDWIG